MRRTFATVAIGSIMAGTAFAQPDIVSREDWGAKPPIEKRVPALKNRAKGKRRVSAENVMPIRGDAKYLTVHHTARRASKRMLQRNLSSFQSQMFGYTIDYGNGTTKKIYLGDIPYHYFIDGAGRIAQGRQLKYAAYSNTVYKTPIEQHITVVLDGNFERSKPAASQVEALTALLAHLAKTHDIDPENIGTHRDVAQTLCPGKNLAAQMDTIRAEVRARLGG